MVGSCGAGVALAAALQSLSLPENEAYLRVAMTRHYWFLSEWRWYELIGIAAPLAILGRVAAVRQRDGNDARTETRTALARMAMVAGIAALTVAVPFARVGLASHLVARLQPLRIFQLVYVVMILAVGAELAERVLRRRTVRWVAAFAVLAVVMVVAERQTFPASPHIELRSKCNGMRQRTSGCRRYVDQANTPKDALLALDADYITKPGEDASASGRLPRGVRCRTTRRTAARLRSRRH